MSANFGDALNPWLVEKISGKKAVFTVRGSCIQHYIVSGSIFNWATEWSVVWGAGLADMKDSIDPRCKIKAVRGPLTYMKAKLAGCNIEPIWGDPAILLPKFLPKPTVDHKIDFPIGIIPHYCDTYMAYSHYKDVSDIHIIDPCLPIEEYVKQVWRCEKIASSSLHGLIVADAYGIPNTWVKFTDFVDGDGMKFWDHMAAMDRTTLTKYPYCVDLRGKPPQGTTWWIKQPHTVAAEYRLKEQQDKIWNANPFRKG
jgi:hypothetical protein